MHLHRRLWTPAPAALAVGLAAACAALPLLRGGPEDPRPLVGESRIRAVLEDLYQHQRQGMMNVSPTDGEFLRILAASGRARRALEIGTSNGYSGIWISLGLSENGGKLITLEKDAGRAALARENIKRAGLAQTMELIEGDALEKIPALEGPFDLVFIDAGKRDYLRYLEMVYPKVTPGGMIAAHNVVSHAGDLQDFLARIKTYPDLRTVIALEKGAGISLSYKSKPWERSP